MEFTARKGTASVPNVSPFFAKLNPCIRQLVYNELFGSQRVLLTHIDPKKLDHGNKSDSHCILKYSLEIPDLYPAEQPSGQGRLQTSLLFTCLQGYSEGMRFLAKKTTWVFCSPEQFSLFVKRSTFQPSIFQSCQIYCPFYLDSPWYAAFHVKVLATALGNTRKNPLKLDILMYNERAAGGAGRMSTLCHSMAEHRIVESLKRALFSRKVSGRVFLPVSFRDAARQLIDDCLVNGSFTFPSSYPSIDGSEDEDEAEEETEEETEEDTCSESDGVGSGEGDKETRE